MKGFVETPREIVDLMISELFAKGPPSSGSMVLDPGCGTGAFIEGVIRWCEARRIPIPAIVGIELDPRHIPIAQGKFGHSPTVRIEYRDFLVPDASQYDYIVGNPPYVPITKLTEEEKARYRSLYATATRRFDLYVLFFERALASLKWRGRLVFITPEKFLYVETAAPLRKLLGAKCVERIHMVSEDVFGELVTYPTITTVTNEPGPGETVVTLRGGRTVRVVLPTDGSSWLPIVNGNAPHLGKDVLSDVCFRVSCGVATGADSVFIWRADKLDTSLLPFAYPTIAGRELIPGSEALVPSYVMLVPYALDGRLLSPNEMGPLMKYLSHEDIRRRLEKRTCVSHKPWYAFHENPPLVDILRPKILCKDITAAPRFWVDRKGSIVPRHSVYYIVPKNSLQLDELTEYLNSSEARRWLEAHCQRAANGFLRLQSRVLKQLPIPEPLARSHDENARKASKPAQALAAW